MLVRVFLHERNHVVTCGHLCGHARAYQRISECVSLISHFTRARTHTGDESSGMYESADICRYLYSKYGEGAEMQVSTTRAHTHTNTLACLTRVRRHVLAGVFPREHAFERVDADSAARR